MASHPAAGEGQAGPPTSAAGDAKPPFSAMPTLAASSSSGMLTTAPEHEKAIRNVLHAGGFDRGAKVWVPRQGQVGWVRARLLAKEEGADGTTTFTVVEEEEEGEHGRGGSGKVRRVVYSVVRVEARFLFFFVLGRNL